MGTATTDRGRMVEGWLEVDYRREYPCGRLYLQLDSFLGDLEVELAGVGGVPWDNSEGFPDGPIEPYNQALDRTMARCIEVIREEFIRAADEAQPLLEAHYAALREGEKVPA